MKRTGSGWGLSRRSRGPHDLFLPGRSLYLDREPVGPRGEQEIAPPGALEEGPLACAQVKCLLQLGRFPWSLGAEKDDRRVGCHHGSLVRAQEIASVLRRKPLSTISAGES